MDTLRERLAEAADKAPTEAAPAAELWARGKRAQRLRAAAVLATVLVVGVVGTGIGVSLVDGDRDGTNPEPAGTVDIPLPIEYPVGRELPDLGDAPGPLAAVWLVPRGAGEAPEAVGLVAETGTFGTIPIDVFHDLASRRTNTRGWAPGDNEAPDGVRVWLSADGRRLAYFSPARELVVHDLVSGENSSPLSESDFEARGATWVDATHLFGHVLPGSDADGWVWEPGTAPERVDVYAFAEGFDLWFYGGEGSGPLPWPDYSRCTSPILLDGTGEYGIYIPGRGYELKVPELCDVLGIIDSEILLGHWNSDRMPGDWNDPNDGNGTVVALDLQNMHGPYEDPAVRRVVATAQAPKRVTFATDLIAEALDATAGAS